MLILTPLFLLLSNTRSIHHYQYCSFRQTQVSSSRVVLPVRARNDNNDNNMPVLGVKGLSNWVVVGDVTNTVKPAFAVAKKLEDSGRTVIRVSPYLRKQNVEKSKHTSNLSCCSDSVDAAAATSNDIYKKISDIPTNVQIDAVNLIISPRIGEEVLQEMANRKIRYWFIQPGADGGSVLSKAEELGIIVQQGCVLVQPLPPL